MREKNKIGVSIPIGREIPAVFVRENGTQGVVVLMDYQREQPVGIFFWDGENAVPIPEYVKEVFVRKRRNEKDDSHVFDFCFYDQKGYRVRIEGLSRAFYNEFTNYAKLLSAMLLGGFNTQEAIHEVENLEVQASWKKTIISALQQAQKIIDNKVKGPEIFSGKKEEKEEKEDPLKTRLQELRLFEEELKE